MLQKWKFDRKRLNLGLREGKITLVNISCSKLNESKIESSKASSLFVTNTDAVEIHR